MLSSLQYSICLLNIDSLYIFPNEEKPVIYSAFVFPVTRFIATRTTIDVSFLQFDALHINSRGINNGTRANSPVKPDLAAV